MVLTAAFAAAAVGIGGLAALAMPAGAGVQPSLPDISAEELLSSALAAKPPAMAGTVTVDNALGLPAMPGLPQLGPGESTVRVWADGEERSRVALPSQHGERTLINDGTTLWAWDSSTRKAAKLTPEGAPHEAADPAMVARVVIGAVRESSSVNVDGTAEVAGRAAYELVLAPTPTERTLLREIRVAIDEQTRMPLRLVLLAHGSADPVFSVGFTELTVGPQDPELFRFTPPAGATVTEDLPGAEKPAMSWLDEATVVGDGWDTVLVTRLPDGLLDGRAPTGNRPGHGPGANFDPRALLDRIGTPVSGPWGDGRLITTAVASAIITSDGRIAAGAVPQQVLTEALSR
jgi:outer membrane lipoprotein-sorting protein